ncbi:GAF domain-containing protein [Streptomyces sp. NPDC049906]|uniref:GAF domain-containing protein n=1 Tax=Streptomyces sp. NPDC049906 TaxID=3155656 RepID=UPI003424D534
MSEDDRAATHPPRLPPLLDAVLEIGTDLDLSTTLQRVVTRAAELTDARYGALGVLDLTGGPGPRLTELYTTGLSAGRRARLGQLPDGHTGLIGTVIDDPRPLRIADLTADPRAHGLPPGHPPMRSFLGVPIHVGHEVFGNLYLTEKRTGTFTEEDTQLLRVLAAQAGIAIGNARLYETARQRERWIEGAAAVTTALLAGGTAAHALETVAERARVLAGAAAGVILQQGPDGGLEVVAAAGPPGLVGPAGMEVLAGAAVPADSPVLGRLLAGESVCVPDPVGDPHGGPAAAHFGPVMLLPLTSGGRPIGTLALPRHRGARPYTPAERLMASQFAAHAALALVLADAQARRERLAVYEDRDRIARDLHDLVVQRLFATGLMLESTQRRAERSSREGGSGDPPEVHGRLARAVDELDATVQEVRTAIVALQQPPTDAPATLRGRVLRETGHAAAVCGFAPSVRFVGPVDALVGDPVAGHLVAALRRALAAATARAGVSRIAVTVDAAVHLADGRPGVRLTVDDGAPTASDGRVPGTTPVTWHSPL